VEVRAGVKRWRELSEKGPLFLVIGGAFSAAMVIVAFVLAGYGKIGDLALAGVVFALALFAVSPAVLLLLGRPLAGLDNWTPGAAGADGKGDDAEAVKEPTK
jgi:membrane protein implicated in regulation of membrane protease activity